MADANTELAKQSMLAAAEGRKRDAIRRGRRPGEAKVEAKHQEK